MTETLSSVTNLRRNTTRAASSLPSSTRRRASSSKLAASSPAEDLQLLSRDCTACTRDQASEIRDNSSSCPRPDPPRSRGSGAGSSSCFTSLLSISNIRGIMSESA